MTTFSYPSVEFGPPNQLGGISYFQEGFCHPEIGQHRQSYNVMIACVLTLVISRSLVISPPELTSLV